MYQLGMTYETADGKIISDTLLRDFSKLALGGNSMVQRWEYDDHDSN